MILLPSVLRSVPGLIVAGTLLLTSACASAPSGSPPANSSESPVDAAPAATALPATGTPYAEWPHSALPLTAAPSTWPTLAPWPSTSYPPGQGWRALAVVDLPSGALHTAVLQNNLRVLRLHTSGPRAVFTDARGPEGKYNEMIFLADVASGTVRKIYTATGRWHVWEPVIDGAVVYWMEGKSEQWRIRSLDVTSGDLCTVLEGRGDPSYNLTVGDGRLALVRRTSGASDSIEIRSLTDARLIRTIETDGRVYKVALSGEAVFYSSGKVDSAGIMTTANAWLSTPSHPAPLLVAKDAYELDAHENILTWVSDPAGHGRSDQVMAARIDNVAPVALTPTPHGDLTGSAWPATGDGFVAWRSDWLGLKVPARLAVWSPGMLTAVGIGGTAAVGMVGVRDGWVVWFTEYDEYADPPTPAMIAGIRVADLAAVLNRGG